MNEMSESTSSFPQESVWDYPRPPRVEPVSRRIRVELGGETIADTTEALRVLETSHPPVYYIPRDDIRMELLQPVERSTYCEWKGAARYFDVAVEGHRAAAAAWSYDRPAPGFEAIAGHVAFYPGQMDACYVGDERVQVQPGSFYGGWITSNIVGPFKGGPGSHGW
jgi:uncharacterized protein (DUF427 family)